MYKQKIPDIKDICNYGIIYKELELKWREIKSFGNATEALSVCPGFKGYFSGADLCLSWVLMKCRYHDFLK